jgi:plasmid rolling circle replication initiator protein Rep
MQNNTKNPLNQTLNKSHTCHFERYKFKTPTESLPFHYLSPEEQELYRQRTSPGLPFVPKSKYIPERITPDDLEQIPEAEDYSTRKYNDVYEDENLRDKKILAKKFAKKVRGFNKAKADKLDVCSDSVYQNSTYSDNDGAIYLKSGYNSTCKNNLCPTCNARKIKKLGGESETIVRKMIEDNSHLKFVFITFTLKNPYIKDLNAFIKFLNQSWQRLSQTKAFKEAFGGYIKALECPPQKTNLSKANVHFHVVAVIDTRYGNSLSHAELLKMWQKALRIDYKPGVFIESVYLKDKDGKKIDAKNMTKEEKVEATISSVRETIKYPAKSTDLMKLLDDNLKIMMEQLHKVRLISYGGIFSEYRKDLRISKEILKKREKERIAEDTSRVLVKEEEFAFGKPKLLNNFKDRKLTIKQKNALNNKAEKMPLNYYLNSIKYSKEYQENSEFRKKIAEVKEKKLSAARELVEQNKAKNFP